MTRLIIDTDPGVDDAHAILLGFAHPDAQIEAICTVAGNVSLERTTANACTILDVLGVDVPVYPGCDGAIIRAPHDAAYVHGDDGLGNSHYPPARHQPESEHAVLALIRLANESPGELTLCAIGPLTNLALATRLDPSLPQKYKRLVVMGGAIRGMGNMAANPSAEFNAWTDPEAAAIVFENWPGLELVSWETTMAYGIPPEDVDKLMSAPTPRGEFFRKITRNTLEMIERLLNRKMLFAPDPLAVAIAIEPDLVRHSERRYVQVEPSGSSTRGQTTVDWFGLTQREPNINLILEVDRDRFWERMLASVE